MARKRQARRRFGSVRKLPSGRYQARYRGPDAEWYTAPITYPTTADADAFLSTVHADIVRQTWKAPRRVTVTLREYGAQWIQQRPGLRLSTRTQYSSDFANHIDPYLGVYRLDGITPAVVREWYGTLAQDLAEQLADDERRARATRRTGESTVARSYRLLRAMMSTAVEDDIIDANPCRISKGGTYTIAERPTLTVPEVERLATEVPHHYFALVHVLAWCGLRLGEACELRRSDIDIQAGTITVRRAVYPVQGEYVIGEPKSAAGRRTVAMPDFVTDAVRIHMMQHCALGSDVLVFSTRTGGCAYGAVQQALTRALHGMNRTDVRVHDLRHTGQVLASQQGATLADIMARLGHSTVDAAMRYAHASGDHGRAVADKMGSHRADVIAISRGQRNP